MVQISKEDLDTIQRAFGDFLWLKNNMHNYLLPEFKTMLEKAMESAQVQYDKIEIILMEPNG